VSSACWDQSTQATHSFQSRGCGGSPSLLPHHTGWIDIVDVSGRSPLTVSGVLCGLGGERVEAPSTPCTILGIDFEQLLQFSLWYK
jgi:hypothetical protein